MNISQVDRDSKTPSESKNVDNDNHTEKNTEPLQNETSVEPNTNPTEITQQNPLQSPESSHSKIFTGQVKSTCRIAKTILCSFLIRKN